MYKNSPIAAWRNQKSLYLLEGVRCFSCNEVYYPIKYRCKKCLGNSFEPFTFSGEATLLSFTQIVVPPSDFLKYAPYCIALVRLKEGPTMLTQLTNVVIEDLFVGMHLVSVFRRYFSADDDGMIFYGIKFMPSDLA